MTGNSYREVDDQAAAWAARMLSGAMTTPERKALDDWLSKDIRHRKAYAEYMEITDLAQNASGGPAEEILESDLENFAARESGKKARRYWYVASPALAACLAAALFFGGVFMPSSAPLQPERHQTARGETLEVNLADGSRITLNTNSVVEVLYADDERQVSLDSGEALFEVVFDPGRPFRVDTHTAEVLVVGTTFNVRALEAETTISVLSGTVNVSVDAVGAQTVAKVTLGAGQALSGDGDAVFGDVYAIDTQTAAAWRRGMAFYENEPLTSMISDLNRYYRLPLVIGDESLAGIPVTGGFDVTNQDATVQALAVALSLEADRQASAIVLKRRE